VKFFRKLVYASRFCSAIFRWRAQASYRARGRTADWQASALFDPPIEPVSIPYENGKTLPGYFMRASGTGGQRPTVMILGGGDTTCEELYDFGGGAAAVRRGYNAFLWEGPGQVGAYALDPSLTYRPDWGSTRTHPMAPPLRTRWTSPSR
jgi:hypothetical protein